MTNISIALNANNDIYIGPDGNLAFVNGVEAVQQDCLCAMRAQRGEMFLQLQDGMPNFDDVWLSKNIPKWTAAGRATLMSVPGVAKVQSFTVSINGDTLNYIAVIQTTYSPQLATVAGTFGA